MYVSKSTSAHILSEQDKKVLRDHSDDLFEYSFAAYREEIVINKGNNLSRKMCDDSNSKNTA